MTRLLRRPRSSHSPAARCPSLFERRAGFSPLPPTSRSLGRAEPRPTSEIARAPRQTLLLRFAVAFLLCAASLAPLARAAVAPADWKNRQSLPVERPGLVKLALPPATLDAARPGFEGLRLLDPAGREAPFVIEQAAAPQPPVLHAPDSFRANLSDTATHLLIKTGTSEPLDAVELRLPPPSLREPGPGFIKAARVELSADGDTWELLHAGAPLFHRFGTGHSQLSIPLEGRRAAWVRLTISDLRSRPQPFTGADLRLAATTPPDPTTPLEVRITRRDDYATETVLTLDLGAAHLPLASLEFLTSEPLFSRRLTVSVRELRRGVAAERILAHGSIHRIAADGVVAQDQLVVPLDFVAPSRELLVHLVNADSPPLALDGIRAKQRPRWLVFSAAQPGTFTVLTGNPQAAAPLYDLSTLAADLRALPPSPLALGPLEPNPAFRPTDTLADAPLAGATLDVTPWALRKPVLVSAAGVQELELDSDVLAGAEPGFADLRLVRDGTQLPYLLEVTELTRSVPLVLTPARDPARPHVSRWEVKLPRAGLPLKSLSLTATTPVFERQLRLLRATTNSEGDTALQTVVDFSWSRTSADARPLTLFLAIPPGPSTLFLETDDGDNAPLQLASATATHAVARLLFKAAPGDLALYYGNPSTAAPRYDLALVAAQVLAAEKLPATLGAEEKTADDSWLTTALHRARGGPLLWGALALVVVVLLTVIKRLLPKPPR